MISFMRYRGGIDRIQLVITHSGSGHRRWNWNSSLPLSCHNITTVWNDDTQHHDTRGRRGIRSNGYCYQSNNTDSGQHSRSSIISDWMNHSHPSPTVSSVLFFNDQHIIFHSSSQQQQQQRRSYFTEIIEPNSNSSLIDIEEENDKEIEERQDHEEQKPVMERPCSLILAEEFISIPPLGYDVASTSTTSSSSTSSTTSSHSSPHSTKKKFKSWHRSFSNIFPNQHGIAYTKWSVSDPTLYDPDISSMTTFDAALSTMKTDFRTLGTLIPSPIFIARGPVLSWMAQFYLESLPLAGLIMIDPLPFTTERAHELYQTQYDANKGSNTSSTSTGSSTKGMILSKEYYDIIQDYNEHWDHWTLKIEAGSIPMLILSTKVSESMAMDDDDNFTGDFTGEDDNGELQFSSSGGNVEPTDVEDTFLWREYAEQTAQRHSGGGGSTPTTVSVIDIDANNIKQCSAVINDWINDKVL